MACCAVFPSQLFPFHSFTLRVIVFCSLSAGTPRNVKDISKPEQNCHSGVKLESPFYVSVFFNSLPTKVPMRQSFKIKSNKPAQKQGLFWGKKINK